MKTLFLMIDSFRRDHIGAYGNRWIHTPHLDRLAAMANVFDQNYIGSYPTTPNRRDIHLGHGDKDWAFNPWRPIDADEITLTERLSEKNVHTTMITDVANGVTWKGNMDKGFAEFWLNPGQEGDRTMGPKPHVPLTWPVPPELIRYRAGGWHQVLMNRAHRQIEDDYFAPGTYRMACEWLERNYKRDNFFLWVECFDPHEPWDPPQWYLDLYDPGYEGRVFEAPPYGFYKNMGITDREIRHVQARYAAEVTMVDAAVGRLLHTLEKLALLDEVALIVTSDHGIYAGHDGDAGLVCKPWCVGKDNGTWLQGGDFSFKGGRRWLPIRTGVARTPLFIRLPRQRRARRIRHITQPWDLTPTVLDLFGIQSPKEFYGQSLLPLCAGRPLRKPRAAAFHGAGHEGVHHHQASNAQWIYACWTQNDSPDWLIDLRHDPAQTKNVARRHPEVCRALRAEIEAFAAGRL